jgi:hypothetical protein
LRRKHRGYGDTFFIVMPITGQSNLTR